MVSLFVFCQMVLSVHMVVYSSPLVVLHGPHINFQMTMDFNFFLYNLIHIREFCMHNLDCNYICWIYTHQLDNLLLALACNWEYLTMHVNTVHSVPPSPTGTWSSRYIFPELRQLKAPFATQLNSSVSTKNFTGSFIKKEAAPYQLCSWPRVLWSCSVPVVTRWTVDQEVMSSNPTHGGILISVVRSLSEFTQPIQ